MFDQAGKPINSAKISVANRDHAVHTGKDGDYWRILLAGEYEIHAFKKDYETQIKKVTVRDGIATVLNFTLKGPNAEAGSGRELEQAQNTILTQQPASNQQETNNQGLLNHKLNNLLQTSDMSLPSQEDNFNQLIGNNMNLDDLSQADQQPLGFNSISEPSEYGLTDADARQMQHPGSTDKGLLDHIAMESPFEQLTNQPKSTTFYDDNQQMYDDLSVNRNNFFERKFDTDSDSAH